MRLLLAFVAGKFQLQVFLRAGDAFQQFERNLEFAVASGAGCEGGSGSQPFENSKVTFRHVQFLHGLSQGQNGIDLRRRGVVNQGAGGETHGNGVIGSLGLRAVGRGMIFDAKLFGIGKNPKVAVVGVVVALEGD